MNSTVSGACVNNQNVLTLNAGTGNWEVGPPQRVSFGAIEGVLAGPGQGIVLGRHSDSSPKPNRMVGCGATGYVGGMKQSTAVWTSDDGGASYQISAGTGMPAMGGMAECQVVELRNGSIMVNSRNEIAGAAHPHTRVAAISNDGGASFEPYYFAEELQEPTCSAGLINLGNTLYFSNPNTQKGRDMMTVKKSTDSGATWVIDTLVWAGPAAYSNLVPISKCTYGVVYERGVQAAYQWITLATVSLC